MVDAAIPFVIIIAMIVIGFGIAAVRKDIRELMDAVRSLSALVSQIAQNQK